MKAVVAAFNQEKALVGAFSVITNLRMDLFEALVKTQFESIGEHIKYNKILGSRASGQNIHKIDRKTPFGNERVERIKAPAV